MHQIAIVAMHGFVSFDLSIPCEVFGRVRLANGARGYNVRVCGEAHMVQGDAFKLVAPYNLDEVANADTIIVPGLADAEQPVSSFVLSSIRSAWQNGARIASICSGAFVLAGTGLLDGCRATTHWSCASQLARTFPRISVDPAVLYIDQGRIVTSAGASAGLDMCLHLVRRDYGQSVASAAARMAVAPLFRDGGQAQFIRYEPPAEGSNLASLLRWMRENAHRPLTIDAIAARARVSTRTLARRFRQHTGVTPLQCLLRIRVSIAQELLETTSHSIERVAAESGFDAAATLRLRFQSIVGVSPREYRKRYDGGRGSHALAPVPGAPK